MTWPSTITETEVKAWAEMSGLSIDPAHLPSVTVAMVMLGKQAEMLFSPPVPAEIEPAAVFRP
jgi:hypothetical protein